MLKRRVAINRYPTRFDDPHFEEGLIATIEELGAGLVVIDTLGKTLGQDQPENDNDVANGITGMLSRIAARTGCATLFTHHVGHNDQGRARGASAWEQGLDFEYVIEGDREDLDAGEPLTLRARKMRDGAIPPPVGFRLKRLPGLSWTDADGRDEAFRSAAIECAHTTAAVTLSVESRVFVFVEARPDRGKGEVRAGVVGGNPSVDAALTALVERGAIEDRGGGNRHKYRVTSGWMVNDRGQVEDYSSEFSVVDADDGEEAA